MLDLSGNKFQYLHADTFASYNQFIVLHGTVNSPMNEPIRPVNKSLKALLSIN